MTGCHNGGAFQTRNSTADICVQRKCFSMFTPLTAVTEKSFSVLVKQHLCVQQKVEMKKTTFFFFFFKNIIVTVSLIKLLTFGRFINPSLWINRPNFYVSIIPKTYNISNLNSTSIPNKLGYCEKYTVNKYRISSLATLINPYLIHKGT